MSKLRILVRSKSFAGRKNAAIHQSWLETLKNSIDVDVILSGKGFDQFGREEATLKEIIKYHYGDSKPDVVVFYTWDKSYTCEADKVQDVFKILVTCDEIRIPNIINEFHAKHGINLAVARYRKPEVEKLLKVPVEYLPHSVDIKVFKDYQLPKQYDVSFFGTCRCRKTSIYADRIVMCQKIIQLNKYKYKIGGLDSPGGDGASKTHIVAETYNASKASFVVPSGRNFLLSKYFEIPACRTLMLCKDTLGLSEVFEKDKHYVLFENFSDFEVKLDYYLRNDVERQKITDAGYEHVRANHTHEIRINQFINILKKYV